MASIPMTPSEKEIEDELQAIQMSKYRVAQVRILMILTYTSLSNYWYLLRKKMTTFVTALFPVTT